MKKKINTIIIFLVLVLSSIMIVGALYYTKNYPKQEFDQILYYFFVGLENTAPSLISDVISRNFVPVIAILLILILFTVKNVKNKIYLKLIVQQNK